MASLSEYSGTIDVNMPYSIETEQAVLGSLLVDSSSFDDVASILSPNYFYNHQNEEIFREMQLLQTSGKPIDFITVLDAVVTSGVFSNKEDAKVYLYSIAESVPALSNTLSYAQIVKDKYITRSLINACKDVIDSSSDAFNTPEQLLDLAEQKIYDIREGKDSSEMSTIMDVSFNVLADLEKLNGPDKSKYLGISTGFAYLDKITTGLNKSDLIVLAARPSVGKTSFALNICSNIVRTRNDVAVAIFSLEMTKEQIAQRIISSLAGVKSQKFRTGDFTDDEMDRITEATSELYSAKLYLDDTSGISLQEIKAKARRIKNLGLIVVDYLQLMSGSGRRSENRVNEISEITRSFKVMAKELNVPIILLSQLSRGTEKEKRRPMLSDLRDSGSIEQDADIVMFLHRESTDEEREAAMQEILLLVAKNRHGEVRNIHLNFEGDITRFTTVEYERDDY
ncbi:MAG: replicative DNA helicase [Oscillospiraceae bacterium]|nr:replicative DNA helicase [Oscillospiraceae bacterium]